MFPFLNFFISTWAGWLRMECPLSDLKQNIDIPGRAGF